MSVHPLHVSITYKNMFVFYIHIYSYTYICIYMWCTHAHIYVCMFTFESESPEVAMAQNSQCRPGWLWMCKGTCHHIWLYLTLVCFIDDILSVALLNLGYKFVSTCPVGQSHKENDQLQDWRCPSIFQTACQHGRALFSAPDPKDSVSPAPHTRDKEWWRKPFLQLW